MATEIERKFLVAGDFSKEIYSSQRIVQGYICSLPGRTVRVRIRGEEGFLTIKGASDEKGLSRYEFEQKIPLKDAEQLLTLCEPGVIDKIRHLIKAGEHTWEVDVFHGANEGLVIAEIELTSEDEPFEKPAWLGQEVSGDRRYYNSMLTKHPYTQWDNN
ncbi:CYTH domain-containing protein [Parabacteroides bouchesdurhonensis]|uniref:CYTH domain-containing protein n=1 Tax=Parabacteroides bouchesdurhonensis TaxID=1936995 RepID=UPI000E48FAA1|nr:CYTH domain-containing protein [Parabacteroides bouchesdurhonensis]RHJ93444.1 CYTH domain-containing protein [Bacteroides sp. AM07-16]